MLIIVALWWSLTRSQSAVQQAKAEALAWRSEAIGSFDNVGRRP